MAITGQITVNETDILEVDASPITSGVAATIGSLAIMKDGTGVFQKTSSPDTGWTLVSRTNSARTILYNTTEYANVQAAINAAELRSEADDQVGVTIVIPTGIYSTEDLTIRKSVSLAGYSSEYEARFNSISIRPFSSSSAQSKVKLSKLNFFSSTFSNETSSGSGVFNTSPPVIILNDVDPGTLNANRIGELTFNECNVITGAALTYTFNYCQNVTIKNSAMNSIFDWYVDDSVAHLPTSYDGGTLKFINSQVYSVALTKNAGTVSSYLNSTDSHFDSITQNGNSDIRLTGGAVQLLTQNNSNNVLLDYNAYAPYAPATPADWTTPPKLVQTALDQLASNHYIKVLSGDVTTSGSAATVVKIQNRDVANTAPTSGQALVWNSTTSKWEPGSISGAGETNTASNVGTAGTGVFKQKTGVNLEFKKIYAASSKVTVVDNTGASQVDLDVSMTLDDLTDTTITSPAANDYLKYNGSQWINTPMTMQTNAGAGINYFLSATVSGISTYDYMSKTPDTVAEVDESIVVNNNTVAFEQYIADADLGDTTIDPGLWSFNIFTYVSINAGSTKIFLDVYKRTSGGTETLLFTVDTGHIAETSVALYKVETVQPAYTTNSTDRLLFKFRASTTSNANVTVHLVHSGTSHYTFASTPLLVHHNDLSDLQGGSSNQYYHLTSTEYTGTGTGTFVRSSSPNITTPTGIVKNDVGLGNVDNTSDATKNAAAVTLTNKTIAAATISGKLTANFDGDQRVLSQDGSKSREFVWSTTASGALYTLVGQFVMWGISHNVALDASGNFLGRDDTDACELFLLTETGETRWYYAPSNTAGTVPTFTLGSSITSAGVQSGIFGDVTGTLAASVVSKLQGRTLASTAPTSGQVIAWNSGTSQWEPTTNTSEEYFGDGSDGNVSLSSGTTTLTRDMYYDTLTLSGTASINTAFYKIFCRTNLDLTNAPANAIFNKGTNGNNAPGGAVTAGTAPTAQTGVTLGAPGTGGAGGAGGPAGSQGVQAAAPTALAVGNGSAGGAGGAGGNSPAGSTGGASRAGAAVTASLPIRRLAFDFLRGVTLIGGGAGGAGGSGGGGANATGVGGGGGSGGNGGGVLVIFAKTVTRGASTAVGAISVAGGIGGNGGTGTSAASNPGGGGGGGAGGGGGWIYIFYQFLAGATGTNIIDASGGAGGTGGAGLANVTTSNGGNGGTGGTGGRITLLDVDSTNGLVGTETSGGAGSAGGAGGAPTAGTSGAGGVLRASL